jgi:hypothetical protein
MSFMVWLNTTQPPIRTMKNIQHDDDAVAMKAGPPLTSPNNMTFAQNDIKKAIEAKTIMNIIRICIPLAALSELSNKSLLTSESLEGGGVKNLV